MNELVQELISARDKISGRINAIESFIAKYGQDPVDGFFTCLPDDIIVYILQFMHAKNCRGFLTSCARMRNISPTIYSDFIKKEQPLVYIQLQVQLFAITEYVISIGNFLIEILFGSKHTMYIAIAHGCINLTTNVGNDCLSIRNRILISPIFIQLYIECNTYLITDAKYFTYESNVKAYFIDRIYLTSVIATEMRYISKYGKNTSIRAHHNKHPSDRLPACSYEFYLYKRQSRIITRGKITLHYPSMKTPEIIRGKFMKLYNDKNLPYCTLEATGQSY